MQLCAQLPTFFQSDVRPLREKGVKVESCRACGRALLSQGGRRTLGGGRLTLEGGRLTLVDSVFSQGSRAAGVKLTPEALESGLKSSQPRRDVGGGGWCPGTFYC